MAPSSALLTAPRGVRQTQARHGCERRFFAPRNFAAVSPDGVQPSMRFMNRGAPRPRELARDCLAIYGRIAGPATVFARADLASMPAEQLTSDVGTFARGESGSAVRFRAFVDAARPLPGALYVNFEDRAGGRRLAHFLA